MKLPAIILCFGMLTFSANAFAGCDYPKSPANLPTGETEGKDEMLEAQKSVKVYVESMEAYLKCLDEEIAAMGDEATEEHLVIRNKRHNAAVDAMDEVAASFNVAVRAYKARQ